MVLFVLLHFFLFICLQSGNLIPKSVRNTSPTKTQSANNSYFSKPVYKFLVPQNAFQKKLLPLNVFKY